MKIERNVELPDFRRLGEVSKTVMDFAESQDKTLKFACDTEKEAKSAYSTATSLSARYGLPLSVKKYNNDIYIIKED